MPETKADIKSTVNLPTTDFPIRAGLLQKEPEILAKWEQIDLSAKQDARQDSNKGNFIMHDGPPYPNGPIHMGHALNKIIKDVVVRARRQMGYQSDFIPGWDCHGLPIENQLLKELKSKGQEHKKEDVSWFREQCKEFSLSYVEQQKKAFQRLGIHAKWNTPYLTLNPEYEGAVISCFADMAAKGLIYRGKKPIHWCPTCETALAEAEIEYADHRSPSIYVKFSVTKPTPALQALAGDRNVHLLVWTTTPWTLPSNVALAAHPDFTYSLLKVGNELFVVGNGQKETLQSALGWEEAESLGELKGTDLVQTETQHPFEDRSSTVYPAHFVTDTEGTGFVHIAPGHGGDDYLLGQTHGLPTLMPINSKGCFTKEAPQWEGQFIFDANKSIGLHMQENNTLVKLAFIKHSYPHCWRCHNPVIFRATEQWFVAMDTPNTEGKTLRELALDQLPKHEWLPSWGLKRITSMVENRPDWCISRQRYWGIPIPVFICNECEESHFDQSTLKHVGSLIRAHGTKIWFDRPTEDLLPADTHCKNCQKQRFRKSTDILDVWFESGSSFRAVLGGEKADLYLEGSDQHRGWFQSSLLIGLGATESMPYKTVLTHGFIVDDKGKKMSKSQGNVLSPEAVIKDYGADILRWWVAGTDFRNDISISKEILTQARDSFSKVRNTIRFLLSNLYDFDPEKDQVSDLEDIDAWVLSKLTTLNERIQEHYRQYQLHQIVHQLHDFSAVTLSAHYMDVVKDRLYCDAPQSATRRSTQTAMYRIVDTLLRLLSPILVFTAEDAYAYFNASNKAESVHLLNFVDLNYQKDAEFLTRWEALLDIRSAVYQQLETMRKDKLIRSFLETKVTLTLPEAIDFSDWANFLIVSQVEVESGSDFAINIEKLEGEKCARCWKYLPLTQELCERCYQVVTAK